MNFTNQQEMKVKKTKNCMCIIEYSDHLSPSSSLSPSLPLSTVWDSDPAEPFEIPEHFKEQIRQVEGKVVTPSDRPESPPDIDMEVSRIQKNIVR